MKYSKKYLVGHLIVFLIAFFAAVFSMYGFDYSGSYNWGNILFRAFGFYLLMFIGHTVVEQADIGGKD